MTQVDKLLELLTKRTLDGRVSWQETDFADTYHADFNNLTLRLAPFRYNNLLSVASRALQPDEVGSYIPHVLEIRNSDGKLIEKIGVLKPEANDSVLASSTLRQYKEIEDANVSSSIRRLYEAVQRHLDVPNAVIEALIEKLQ